MDISPDRNTASESSSSSERQNPSPLVPSPPESTLPQAQQAQEAQELELTALRAHYLKKTLISLQLNRELNLLLSTSTYSDGLLSTLSYLGPPFSPPPKGSRQLNLPFLKFMFRQCVLSFPFLSAAPRDFFPKRVQPFMTSLIARDLSSATYIIHELDKDGVDPEHVAKQKMLSKFERRLAFLLGSATKLVQEEEVVRLTQKDLDRLTFLAKKREAKEKKNRDLFDVNVICVRHVLEKGKVRRRIHEEFIIRTRRAHQPDVFVSRRYGDFKTLADELRKAHPQEMVPEPPLKDRTTVTLPMSATQSSFSVATSPTTSSNTLTRSVSLASTADEVPVRSPSSSTLNSSRLAREKNRLTLRAYLHSILTSSKLASSPVLKSFLLSGPTNLRPDEVEDAKRREGADTLREEGRKEFANEVAARVDNLRAAVKNLKENMMGKGGLATVFATVKATEHVKKLPPDYRAVLEWGRVSLAATIFRNLVASDSASEALASLKRVHGQMPYFVLKGILKISNPPAMIRGLLDLFLAQPFGGRSLLQRLFTSSLAEEAKALQEEIAAVHEKVGDPQLCEKIQRFVEAPKEIQNIYKSDAAEAKTSLIAIILRTPEQPVLNRSQLLRVSKASRAHAEYLKYRENLADSDDDDGPQNDDAWLFEDLILLAKLYARLRDRQQLIALIFEGTTAELLKDIITIFYSPLAQVYKAASIADSLGDLQDFLDDLIKTVQKAETANQGDPHRTVQTFVDLVQRHEQAFYNFVHKVYVKGDKLFDSLMKWVELLLTVIRDGLGDHINLEFLLPDRGQAREGIMKEVDNVALYHYKLKVVHEGKLRRRFGRQQETSEDEVSALVDGVVKDLSFGEMVHGAAADMEAEVSSDEDSETETESESDGTSEETSSEQEESEEAIPPQTAPPSQSIHHDPMASLDFQSTRTIPSARPKRSMTLEPTAKTPSIAALSNNTPPVKVDSTPPTSQLRQPRISQGSSSTSVSTRDKRTNQLSNSSPRFSPSGSSVLGSPQISVGAQSASGHSPRGEIPAPMTKRVPSVQKLSIPPPPRIPAATKIRRQLEPAQRKKKPKVDEAGVGIEPPELKAIAEILPLFLELMCPLLKPRAL